jgi:hypothetical protein
MIVAAFTFSCSMTSWWQPRRSPDYFITTTIMSIVSPSVLLVLLSKISMNVCTDKSSKYTTNHSKTATMFRIFMGGLEDINVVIYTFSASNTNDKQNWLNDFTRVQNDDESSNRRMIVRSASKNVLH